MKLQYLGTAAYEGIPAIFCECDNCVNARKMGGKNIRTRSQALLDDRLLIDLPADTYAHFLKYQVPLHKISACLITHSHTDHLYTGDFEARKDGFSHIKNGKPFTVYGGKAVYEKSSDAILRSRVSFNDLRAFLVNPFVPFDADGYKVTALNATHDPNSSPYVYLIEKDGKAMLYSHDTSSYPQDSWDYLRDCGVKIDLVSLDCTHCETEYNPWPGHMNLWQCADMREELNRIGVCNADTKFVLNHFTHNAKHCLYDEFITAAQKENFVVSYDGMVIEF